MGLNIVLKANEKILVGGTVIINGSKRSTFDVINDTVILRERDIMTEELADTPAKAIYLMVQLMYMKGSFEQSTDYHETYWDLTKAFSEACPNVLVSALINDISENIMNGNFYQALKFCKELIEYETGVLNYASSNSSNGVNDNGRESS